MLPIGLIERADPLRAEFTRRDLPGWRLGFEKLPGALPGLPEAAPFGGFIDRLGLWRAALVCLALSAIGLTALTQGLSIVARLVPYSWEQRLGNTMTGDFGEAACVAPAGQQALNSLARRLSPNARPVRVRVIKMSDANAVALPGGQILIFDKLIEEAQSPDEIAGVLAHEIGHVEHRHVMTMLLRRFGLGMLLGSADYSSQYAQALLDLQYSRSAEHEADDYSLKRLASAHISAAATAALFDRFAAREKGDPAFMSYLGSHPPSAERRAQFIAAARHSRGNRPSLDTAEWRAIRSICAVRRPGE